MPERGKETSSACHGLLCTATKHTAWRLFEPRATAWPCLTLFVVNYRSAPLVYGTVHAPWLRCLTFSFPRLPCRRRHTSFGAAVRKAGQTYRLPAAATGSGVSGAFASAAGLPGSTTATERAFSGVVSVTLGSAGMHGPAAPGGASGGGGGGVTSNSVYSAGASPVAVVGASGASFSKLSAPGPGPGPGSAPVVQPRAGAAATSRTRELLGSPDAHALSGAAGGFRSGGSGVRSIPSGGAVRSAGGAAAAGAASAAANPTSLTTAASDVAGGSIRSGGLGGGGAGSGAGGLPSGLAGSGPVVGGFVGDGTSMALQSGLYGTTSLSRLTTPGQLASLTQLSSSVRTDGLGAALDSGPSGTAPAAAAALALTPPVLTAAAGIAPAPAPPLGTAVGAGTDAGAGTSGEPAGEAAPAGATVSVAVGTTGSPTASTAAAASAALASASALAMAAATPEVW